MKNVDVPLWDKGDSTDNYAKGGGSARLQSLEGTLSADRDVLRAFKLVLGRKPSTRESAYYRISRLEKDDIKLKLLDSKEHKEIIENAKLYPSIVKESKDQKVNILKLKSKYESLAEELEELHKLLTEKNNTIVELRKVKGKPYITNSDMLREAKESRSTLTNSSNPPNGEKSVWDRIIDLFFR